MLHLQEETTPWQVQRRCDISFMVGYSASSKAYRVYNESTGIVEETYDVEFDESNERYRGIDGAEDEEEQRRAMKKMPKGEIKPKEDGEELVDQNGSPSTLEEDEDKPLTPQDGQGKKPSSQVQIQAQSQESPPQDQVSPSRLNNQVQVTSCQVTLQANTSRPRTRQQANIEAQGGILREEQPSPIRASRLFGQPNDEQANNNSEDDGEPLPMQDTHITREQARAQAQDVGTPNLAPQQPQVKRVNWTLAHPSDLIIGSPSQGVKTRSQYHVSFCKHVAFVSCIEPKNVDDALQEEDWVMAMQDELNNFTRNKVWELVERPKGKNVIGTKMCETRRKV